MHKPLSRFVVQHVEDVANLSSVTILSLLQTVTDVWGKNRKLHAAFCDLLLLYAEERALNKMAAVFTAPLWALVCIFQRHLYGEAASLKMHTFYVVFHVDAVSMTEEEGRLVYLSISGEFSEDYF